MIKGCYDREKRYLSLQGHANYAPYGSDIVCAAVSALVYCLVNGCECDIAGKELIAEDKGDVYEAVLRGLFAISEKYPENLKMVPFRK